MKISLDLPDWTDGKHIRVMAGMELVAHQHFGQSMMVKEKRCVSCGKCCEDFPDDYAKDFPPIENGVCTYLKDGGGGTKECSLGIRRPFSCCFTDGKEEYCSVKYKEV